MFGTIHILYMVITAIVITVALVLCALFVKGEKNKALVLKIPALVAVALHMSIMYVDFFTEGSAQVPDSVLLPIYPCNIIMWFLVITAFLKNRETTFARLMSEFTFWAGIVCTSIGIIFNENFGNNPTLTDWNVLKGLLDHSFMLFGCIYILVGKFIKIRVDNLLAIVCGLLFFLVDGAIINGLFAKFNIDPVNSMYLLHPPFANMPWLTTPVMGLAGVALAFSITAVYEWLALPSEERWYNRLKNFIRQQKESRQENN